MPVREVVLERDIRAPVALVPGALRSHYNVRRALRSLYLFSLDVGALAVALNFSVPCWKSIGIGVHSPLPTERLVAAAIVLLTMGLLGLYRSRAVVHGLVRVWQAATLSLVFIGLLMMVSPHSVTPKSAVLIWVVFVAVDSLLRTAAYTLLRRTSAVIDKRPALLIGRANQCQRTAELLAASPATASLVIMGAVLDTHPPAQWASKSGLQHLGTLRRLAEIVDRRQPTALVVADPELVRGRLSDILQLARMRRLTVYMVAPDMGFEGTPVSYMPGFGMPVFVVEPSVTCGPRFVAKRVIDVTLALTALVVLSPLLILVALAIILTSRGSPLYVSNRVGLGQRHFRCLKFRTMSVDAEARQADLEASNEADGAVFKIREDPRITPVGSLLRKTSIDEVPQLINVIKGDMSLVGPRPLPIRDNQLMEDWHRRRHVVLPGLTGPWQISGRSDLSFDRMIELDLRYIENWSLRGDLAILARTLGIVLLGRGAY